MAITRSTSSSPVKKIPKGTTTPASEAQRESFKHFILPKGTSQSARFILLRHPRDSSVQRFLFCPENGFYEFTKVGASTGDPRSLLFTQSSPESGVEQPSESQDGDERQQASKGYISKAAEFFVATPFDFAFVLIPLAVPTKVPTGKSLFQPIDDILEQHTREDKELRYLLEHGRFMFEEAMSRFCDTIEAGDEQMFRHNEDKLMRMVLEKVHSAISHGLPSSLEDKFVTRALEAPVLSVRREETVTSITQTKALAPDEEDEEDVSEAFESQSSAASTAPSAVFSEVSTATSISTAVADSIPPELLELQKQRTVLDFVLASYVPDDIADRLKARLASKDSPTNFTPLEEHLKSLAALRAEALASRSITDFSRKRGLEDDEASEVRAEKKRKQEEEERKKKLGVSRGVQNLKKTNVSGMKKLSDFFAKKPAAKVG